MHAWARQPPGHHLGVQRTTASPTERASGSPHSCRRATRQTPTYFFISVLLRVYFFFFFWFLKKGAAKNRRTECLWLLACASGVKSQRREEEGKGMGMRRRRGVTGKTDALPDIPEGGRAANRSMNRREGWSAGKGYDKHAARKVVGGV
eukprot:TRINITY_DN4922_c0_g1_i1.p3 TRINITY_DN4922_c0_g1~~TRINITY_DN4922_c0_g1_i1.p3  ORF type:complete len:149 (-),score=1.31 TRINITY_DN4922_c0_g1_i1:360-806(-)